MHEHMQVSLLLGFRTKKFLLVIFTIIFAGFQRGFLQKICVLKGRQDQLNPSKLLKIISISGIKQDSFQCYCFDI